MTARLCDVPFLFWCAAILTVVLIVGWLVAAANLDRHQ